MGYVGNMVLRKVNEVLLEADGHKLADSVMSVLRLPGQEALCLLGLRMLIRFISDERSPHGSLQDDSWMERVNLTQGQRDFLQRVTVRMQPYEVMALASELLSDVRRGTRGSEARLEACISAFLEGHRSLSERIASATTR